MINVIKRSFWQAYREQRVVLISTLLLVVVPILMQWTWQMNRLEVIWLTLNCPVLFVLVSLSMSLASDREQQTLDGLRLLQPPPFPFLFGKFLWAFTGLAIQLTIMLAVLLAVTWLWLPADGNHEPNDWLPVLLLSLLAYAEAAAWGLICSARFATTIRALCGAAVGVTASNLIALLFSGSSASWPDVGGGTILRAVVMLVVLMAALRSAAQALRPSSRSTRWLTMPRTLRFEHSDWRFELRRLSVVVWQELRCKAWVGLAVLAALVGGSLAARYGDLPLQWIGFVGALVLASAILGVSASRSILGGRSYECFEQLGISVATVWRSRMIVTGGGWVGAVFVWSLLTSLGEVPDRPFIVATSEQIWTPTGSLVLHDQTYVQLMIVLASLLTLVLSQWVSLAMREPILAWLSGLGVSLVGSLLAGLWMVAFGATWLWILIGLAIACLVAVSARQVKRLASSRRRRIDVFTCCGLAALVPLSLFGIQYAEWLSAVPVTRTFTMPPMPSTVNDPTLFAARLTEPERNYVEIVELLTGDVAGPEAETTINDEKPPLLELTAEQAQQVSRRLLAARGWDEQVGRSRTSADLMQLQELQRQWYVGRVRRDKIWMGLRELPAALDRSLASGEWSLSPGDELPLRLALLDYARFWEQFSPFYDYSTRVYESTWDWCRTPTRTPQELRELLTALRSSSAFDETTKLQTVVTSFYGYELMQNEREPSFYDVIFPGVRRRGDHLMRFQQILSTERLSGLLQQIESDQLPDREWRLLHFRERARLQSQFFMPILPEEDIAYRLALMRAQKLAEQRALMLRIAGRIYELETENELPEDLAELVLSGVLDSLPDDPFTGEPFTYFQAEGLGWVLWSPGVKLKQMPENTAYGLNPAMAVQFRQAHQEQPQRYYTLRNVRGETQPYFDRAEAFGMGCRWSMSDDYRRVPKLGEL